MIFVKKRQMGNLCMQSVTGGFGKAMGENDYAKGRLGVASPPPLCTPHWARLENKGLTSHWECVK